jgi:hypothetical protein
MQFSDNEIIALPFGTSLSEPRGLYVLLQLVPAVNQKRFIKLVRVGEKPSAHCGLGSAPSDVAFGSSRVFAKPCARLN